MVTQMWQNTNNRGSLEGHTGILGTTLAILPVDEISPK